MTAAPTPAAVAAFLRGVERRAYLLAELQCGDAAAAEAALGATMRAFRGGAGQFPMAAWPQRFWSLLVAAPQLRHAVPAAGRLPAWRPLAELGNGARAALLLRLVAGLDAGEAAAVLAIAPDACDEAVRQALSRLAGAQPLASAWADWEAAFQQALKMLPAAQLARLARLREQALDAAPVPAQRVRAPTSAPDHGPGRRRGWAALVVAGACVAALAGTYLRPAWFTADGDPDRRVRTEVLAAAQAPAARFDSALQAWSHRDFALLADPHGLREAGRLPLLAWYAAQQATRAAADAAAAATPPAPVGIAPTVQEAVAVVQPATIATGSTLPPVPPGDAPLPAAVEAAIARVPAAQQPDLRADARRWHAWTPAQQAAYRERQRAWDALSLPTRAELRERYVAWQALDASARRAVAAAARAFAALPPEQQEGQRSNFAAQDLSMQRGWLLGPVLGADYPKLQPLIAQLPEAEHDATLRVLRALAPGERVDLVLLAQRTPPQERAALLRELRSTAAANRAAWLQARVAR